MTAENILQTSLRFSADADTVFQRSKKLHITPWTHLGTIDSKSDEASGTFGKLPPSSSSINAKERPACTESVATVSETGNEKRYAAWDKMHSCSIPILGFLQLAISGRDTLQLD